MISILCFYFIIRSIIKLGIDFDQLSNKWYLLYVPFSVVIYALLIVLMAFVWKLILEFIIGERIGFITTFVVYSKSNIGKYLPTNTMHFVARNIIGNKRGWKHSDIAFSSLLETVLVLFTGTILALLFNYTDFSRFLNKKYNDMNNGYYALIGILLLTVTVISAIWLLLKNKVMWNRFKQILTKSFLLVSTKTVILYSIQFMLMGLLLFFLLNINTNGNHSYVLAFKVISVYSLAWIVGFIFPGSPGGIGVREATLVLLLSPIFGESNALISIVLHRLITILGDGVAFLIGFWLTKGEVGGGYYETNNSNSMSE
ncbi:MAG: lysylphosphatidylglycerol synthase domain-containing protein [Bacilli bacterium]